MSTEFSLTASTDSRGAAKDAHRAGWGAILAAIALIATPTYVFIAPLLGVTFLVGAEKFDPVTNASWTIGLFGLFELAQAVGIALLVVGVRRAVPASWARDLGAIAGTVWVTALSLHAATVIVQNTAAQSETWLSISDEVSVRAMIGASVTVIEWAFLGVAVLAALAWTITYVVAGRPVGIAGLGSGIPALVIASIAAGLAVFGIIPPAAILAQIPLWLIIGIALVRRSRSLRY